MNSELDSKLMNEEPKVTITTTIQEINIVLAGLQELPHKVSDGIIRKIYEQVNSQLSNSG